MLDTTQWGIHYLQITDDLPHYCTARSLLACVCNVWGLLYKGKETVFILRVPLLVQMRVRQIFQMDAARTLSPAPSAF